MPGSLALVAHQGGWDEILLVAGPIVVIVALLAVVKQRVDAEADAADAAPGATGDVAGERTED